MKRLINIVKAVCKRIMADFVQKRMLAEFPHAVAVNPLLGRDYQNDDSRASGPPMVGIL